MTGIVEPLRAARILVRPKKFPPLKGFSCGRSGKPWEKHVNEWARGLHLGLEKRPHTVVVVEDAHGKLLGYCSFRPKPVPVDGVAADAQCILMLGTDRLCRGQRLQDGSRPGDALLGGALEHMRTAADGHMPHVWAFVAAENTRSRALFRRHGFEELSATADGEVICVRPSHKQPAILRRWRPAIGRRRAIRAAP